MLVRGGEQRQVDIIINVADKQYAVGGKRQELAAYHKQHIAAIKTG